MWAMSSGPLPKPKLSSRHLLPGPNALTVQSAAGYDASTAGHRSALTPMGPGDEPRDDSGVLSESSCQGTCSQRGAAACERSEEHTSELQSLMRISSAVFCLKTKRCNTHRS